MCIRDSIYALHDVSELFENYFSTFIKDEGEFAKSLNVQCLGLIAFFYTIPYKNREITTSILCLLYTSDAADERSSVDLGGRRIIKKKKKKDI